MLYAIWCCMPVTPAGARTLVRVGSSIGGCAPTCAKAPRLSAYLPPRAGAYGGSHLDFDVPLVCVCMQRRLLGRITRLRVIGSQAGRGVLDGGLGALPGCRRQEKNRMLVIILWRWAMHETGNSGLNVSAPPRLLYASDTLCEREAGCRHVRC